MRVGRVNRLGAGNRQVKLVVAFSRRFVLDLEHRFLGVLVGIVVAVMELVRSSVLAQPSAPEFGDGNDVPAWFDPVIACISAGKVKGDAALLSKKSCVPIALLQSGIKPQRINVPRAGRRKTGLNTRSRGI